MEEEASLRQKLKGSESQMLELQKSLENCLRRRGLIAGLDEVSLTLKLGQDRLEPGSTYFKETLKVPYLIVSVHIKSAFGHVSKEFRYGELLDFIFAYEKRILDQ